MSELFEFAESDRFECHDRDDRHSDELIVDKAIKKERSKKVYDQPPEVFLSFEEIKRQMMEEKTRCTWCGREITLHVAIIRGNSVLCPDCNNAVEEKQSS